MADSGVGSSAGAGNNSPERQLWETHTTLIYSPVRATKKSHNPQTTFGKSRTHAPTSQTAIGKSRTHASSSQNVFGVKISRFIFLPPLQGSISNGYVDPELALRAIARSVLRTLRRHNDTNDTNRVRAFLRTLRRRSVSKNTHHFGRSSGPFAVAIHRIKHIISSVLRTLRRHNDTMIINAIIGIINHITELPLR